MARLYFHVDIDAFFASVEKIDDPTLAGKPVIIGAKPGGRGVVSTCSYEARAFGVHSAQPISEAYRRCPQGIFLPVRMRRYAEVSAIVMRILGDFSPDLRQLSIDEAALDMTGTERLWGKAAEAAAKMKAAVMERTGLTVSIGAGANPYVAKVASGLGKPDGLTIVPEGSEAEFMASLPLEKLWGAGEKTREALKAVGLTTIRALQEAPAAVLKAKFGAAGSAFLAQASRGQESGVFQGEPASASVSGERTFGRDTSSPEDLDDVLRQVSDELAARLLEQGKSSRTLALKLRFDDFSTITRQMSSEESFASSDQIFEAGRRLLAANWDGSRPVRLVGLGLHGLGESGRDQLSLFSSGPGPSELVRRAAAEIQRRGKGRMQRARFMRPRD